MYVGGYVSSMAKSMYLVDELSGEIREWPHDQIASFDTQKYESAPGRRNPGR